ncbi:hypothetical protein ETD83_02470 [Actinomadura soli]|uniref:Uncharacterized protein n=1 Tax=Actinomadura soli TaxID=2508997 RepID=A0A5C4JK75_9ACTN|nr:hypothetical protein [Actinomadura soli]TMR06905.1 hypothetical protein ETD83_02470 [Actinomadura soli]
MLGVPDRSAHGIDLLITLDQLDDEAERDAPDVGEGDRVAKSSLSEALAAEDGHCADQVEGDRLIRAGPDEMELDIRACGLEPGTSWRNRSQVGTCPLRP